MLTPHEAVLESKCERIARIITRQRSVHVRIEGGRAYIDLDTMAIVLPNLAGGEFDYVDRVLDGFLDHECGHAVLTDNTVALGLKKDQVLFNFWNVAEDAWTERVFGGRYPGVAQNLKALNDAVMIENRKKWGSADPVFKLLVALSDCWRGVGDPDEYGQDPEIGGVFEALADELRDGYTIDSTQAAADLAIRIRDKVGDLAIRIRDKVGDLAKPGLIPPDRAKQVATKVEAEGQGMASLSEASQKQAMALQGLLVSGDFENPVDAESFFNECLAKVPLRRGCDDPEEYIVFSEEFDVDTEYTSEQRLAWSSQYQELKGEVHEYIGNMATALELALAAETESRWVGGASRGRKFDKRVFPLWALGGRDERIYRQREQGAGWDTAVSLLWDCSGSMQRANPGSKSYLARLAALAFHEALSRVNIMHEVLGFNTSEVGSPELRVRVNAAEARGDDLGRYSRLWARDKRMIFVPWGATDGRAICAINGAAANRDGECVLWAAKRLAVRPEKRKVLIVGSDGQPSGAIYGYTEEKYLRAVVQSVINAGIEVYAIGIQDDSVKQYYPECVVIHRPEDLPGAVLRQLAQALFGHKGTKNGDLPAVIKPSSS